MGTIWTVGLSVLGIYVYKRSDDKKVLSTISATTAQTRPSTTPGTSTQDGKLVQFNE